MPKAETMFDETRLQADERAFHGTSQFGRLYRAYAPPANARFLAHPQTHTVYACLLPDRRSMFEHFVDQPRRGKPGADMLAHLDADDAAFVRDQFHKQYGHIVADPADATWVRCPYSITRSIKRFFAEFDQDKAIDCMQKSKHWPKEPYRVYDARTGAFVRGMTSDEIKTAWKKNGADSNLRGTYAHLQFEKYFEQGASACDTSVPEWRLFAAFVRDYVEANGWEPRIPEMLAADDFAVCVFGFIDMVFYDPHKDGYVLVDYKRCKKIKKTSNQDYPPGDKQYGLAPLDDIEDCNWNHYILQLNLARLIVERAYGWRVTKMLLVNVFPPELLPAGTKPDATRTHVVPRWNDAPVRIIHELRAELLPDLTLFCSKHNRPIPALPAIDQTAAPTRHQYAAGTTTNRVAPCPPAPGPGPASDTPTVDPNPNQIPQPAASSSASPPPARPAPADAPRRTGNDGGATTTTTTPAKRQRTTDTNVGTLFRSCAHHPDFPA